MIIISKHKFWSYLDLLTLHFTFSYIITSFFTGLFLCLAKSFFPIVSISIVLFLKMNDRKYVEPDILYWPA